MDCNADLGHPCDANDGEPCDACAAWDRAMMDEAKRTYHWAPPANYIRDMHDSGRGHLIRDEDYDRKEALRRFNRAESRLPQNRGPRQ